MGKRFVANPRFIAEIAHGAEVKRILENKTEAVAAEAKRFAAKGATGDLEEGIEPTVRRGPTGWFGRVVSKDFKTHWFEFGTVKMQKRPFLRTALESVLGRVEGGRS